MIDIKAVLFDFDGTLADTLPVCFLAFESVFKKFDERDVTTEEIKSMFGPSETGIIRENLLKICPDFSVLFQSLFPVYSHVFSTQ
ncbi:MULTISPECIES: HAD hydrolase-like protein [Bacillaceae]|uniref:HAD family hydrolase n=1 Tax=Mesobacillus boroniphilus TaxID=308892 RepID=UPI0009DF6C76